MEIEVTVKPWAGRYPFVPFSDYTTAEWRTVKQLSGYLPLTLDAGLEGGDPEVLTVMALVAMGRAGKIAPTDVPSAYERMLTWVAADAFQVHTDGSEVADDNPPPSPSGASSTSSGDATKTSSAPSEQTPNGSGIPASGSSPLPPVRSGI